MTQMRDFVSSIQLQDVRVKLEKTFSNCFRIIKGICIYLRIIFSP